MTENSCSANRHIGPIYQHLVTETKIEIDPKTLRIKEDAEAIEVPGSTYIDSYSCESCGLAYTNPFYVVDEDES